MCAEVGSQTPPPPGGVFSCFLSTTPYPHPPPTPPPDVFLKTRRPTCNPLMIPTAWRDGPLLSARSNLLVSEFRTQGALATTAGAASPLGNRNCAYRKPMGCLGQKPGTECAGPVVEGVDSRFGGIWPCYCRPIDLFETDLSMRNAKCVRFGGRSPPCPYASGDVQPHESPRDGRLAENINRNAGNGLGWNRKTR